MATKLNEGLVREIEKAPVVTGDLDGTFFSRALGYAGVSLIPYHAKRGRVDKAIFGAIATAGAVAAMKVQGLFRPEMQKDNFGIQAHHTICRFTRTKKGEVEEMLDAFMPRNVFPGAPDALRMLSYAGGNGKKPIVLVSSESSVNAVAAGKYLGADRVVSNETVLDCGERICRARILMQTPEEKFRVLDDELRRNYGLSASQAAYIGNSKQTDLPLRDRFRKFLASPGSDKETRDGSDHWITDYRTFIKDFQSFQLRS